MTDKSRVLHCVIYGKDRITALRFVRGCVLYADKYIKSGGFDRGFVPQSFLQSFHKVIYKLKHQHASYWCINAKQGHFIICHINTMKANIDEFEIDRPKQNTMDGIKCKRLLDVWQNKYMHNYNVNVYKNKNKPSPIVWWLE